MRILTVKFIEISKICQKKTTENKFKIQFTSAIPKKRASNGITILFFCVETFKMLKIEIESESNFFASLSPLVTVNPVNHWISELV